MSFSKKLAELRRERGFTQSSFAERVGVHQSQITRYETGSAYPTFDVLRGIAVVLGVSADSLLFDEDERSPNQDFRLYLKALEALDQDEQKTVRDILDALLLKHEAKRWAS